MSAKSTLLIALGVIGLVAAISFASWMVRWQFRKADQRLAQWAESLGIRIVDKQNANPFGTGPMATRGYNTQVMYRVTVQDTRGVTRHALVKIGSEKRGVLADEFAVVWEDAKTPSSSTPRP